ncbi:MAG: hypothetical protein L6R42_004552 [Xanthoria sp. 1 TBL-2021]|nr:MAG: hypothetical protein L6R42_004552 [Xanthoria sp. 1 TBL-2021]
MGSIQWDKWSGFQGEGIYTIFNKASLTCLEHGDTRDGWPPANVRSSAHIPHNTAQLWRIKQLTKYCELYTIENTDLMAFLTARGDGQVVILDTLSEPAWDPQPRLPAVVWDIDTVHYANEPGKPVVFRSVKYRGHVLRLPSNGKADKPFVYLKQEATKNNAGQHQWVLQKHPEKLPEHPD